MIQANSGPQFVPFDAAHYLDDDAASPNIHNGAVAAGIASEAWTLKELFTESASAVAA